MSVLLFFISVALLRRAASGCWMREGKDFSVGMFERGCVVEEFFVVRNREAGEEEPGQLFGIYGQLTVIVFEL